MRAKPDSAGSDVDFRRRFPSTNAIGTIDNLVVVFSSLAPTRDL
jgi:hypothetical protein